MIWPYKQNASGKTPETNFYWPKQMGEDQSNDLDLDESITLKILDEIAWDFTQAK